MNTFRWKIAQWFENKWWKSYLKGKSPEEYLDWKTRYWTEFLAKLDWSYSSLKEPIIDVGCGPAGIFMIFPKKDTTALDPLLAEYEKLQVFSQTDYPSVKFIPQSFETFETKEKYQTVFCLNAINHFIDLRDSFQKLSEITAPGGDLIVSIDAHNHSFFRKLFALIPFDILHPHQYTLEEYESFLVEIGFEAKRKVLIKKAFFFNYWVLIAGKQ